VVWGSLELAVAVQVRPQIMKLALTFVSGGHSQMAAVRAFGACHAMRIQFIGK
jgi:nanoRNase/pAp phosphatase (c-di-AMP/oligoRNAs hydrolase)